MGGFLEVATNDFVTTVSMNRPPVNALVPELQEELVETLKRLKDENATRVVVLTSAIDRYFMAGADIKAMGGEGGFDRENPATLERVAQMSRRSQAAFTEIEHFSKPLIAAINGHALGGGCELALACDFRVMARGGATIGLPEVRLGLLPSGGGTTRLPRLIGRAAALDLLLRGRQVEAGEAEHIGLVNRAVEAAELDRCAHELAAELLALPPLAVREIKRCVDLGLDGSLSAGLALEERGNLALRWRPIAGG